VIAAKAFEKRIRTAFGPSGDPEATTTPSSDARLDLQLNDRVAAIRRIVSGRVVFTTNFGIEDQAIAHAIFSQGLSIDVVALDTGRLFPETFDLWARTEHRYGQRIVAAYPDRTGLEPLVGHQGINGFIASIEARHACCAVRKAEPLRRALVGAGAWITGLRAVAPGEPERAGRWWWEQEQTIERGPHDCHGARAPASQPSPSSPQEARP
jgi:3'-phosphoadenosine 5'-phosphosulfate sulfotransferase (PAPS reductase)/FAD synthetase